MLSNSPRRSSLGLSIASLAVLVSLTLPTEAAALDKQQRWDRMVELRAEISALKGQQGAEAQLSALLAEYRALSASLGGAEPAGPARPTAPPQMSATFPVELPEGPGLPPAFEICGQTVAFAFSTDTPLPIPDLGSVSSSIDLSSFSGYAQLVQLQLSIFHTFNSDLNITLTSPAGTVVTLSSNNGGGNDNVFNSTVFVDFANLINPPGAVTDLTYANNVNEPAATPEEAMGAFRNENLSGTWTLTIEDEVGQDVGTLNGWLLSIYGTVDQTVDTNYDYASTDTPLAITDNATVTSTIDVSDFPDGVWLCDVDVVTDITHTFNSDLDITFGPSFLTALGYAEILSTGNGSSLDDVFNGATWTDDGGAANPPGPVTDNTFADGVAETPLVAEGAMGGLGYLGLIGGFSPNDGWELAVTDNFDLDEGSINSWNLRLVACHCPSILEIPALDRKGLGALATLLVAAALLVLIRRRL